MNLLLKSHLKF